MSHGKGFSLSPLNPLLFKGSLYLGHCRGRCLTKPVDRACKCILKFNPLGRPTQSSKRLLRDVQNLPSFNGFRLVDRVSSKYLVPCITLWPQLTIALIQMLIVIRVHTARILSRRVTYSTIDEYFSPPDRKATSPTGGTLPRNPWSARRSYGSPPFGKS
jgi:hypothetical protein